MLLTALVPGAQRHAVLEHIPDRHARCEAEGSKCHRLHRGWGQQRRRGRVLLQPAAQPGQLGAAAHSHHGIQFAEVAAVPSPPREGGLQQLPQGVCQPPFLQQALQLTTRHTQRLVAPACRCFFENGLLRQIRITESAFEPFRCVQQGGGQRRLRAAGGRDPAIDVAPPQPQARLAQHVGIAQALAAAFPQLTAPQPQQLGDRSRFAFTPLQRHQCQVEGATAEIDHEQSRARGQAGTEGRGGGFVHQGDLLHRQLSTGLQQPAAVAAVGLHRRRQHQSFHPQLLRQETPDSCEQQGTGPGGLIALDLAAFVLAVNLLCAADVALEVPGQVGVVLVGKPRIKHLLSKQRRFVAEPEQAGHFPDALADRGQIQQAGVAFTGCREGHHGGGAAQVDGQGACDG